MPERQALRTLTPELRRFWKAELGKLGGHERETVVRTLVQHYGPVVVERLMPKGVTA